MKNKQPLISVIVPIYNVEAYLPRCLNSIIKQTYAHLEILLIDDGSTDSCPQICERYALNDDRVKVIHKLNGGLSSARNAGLDVATGEYVAFVDSDDWLELNMYEEMIKVAEVMKADLVSCDAFFWKYGNNECKTISRQTGELLVIEDNDELFRHILEPNPTIRFEVWNKLFCRSIIGDCRFKIDQRYEDVYFDRIVFRRVRRCVTIDKALYNYQQGRPGSTISSFNIGRLSKLDELDEYISDFKSRNKSDIVNIFCHYAIQDAFYFWKQAVKYGYENDTKRMIHERFCDYYNVCDERSLVHLLFKYFPVLFFPLCKF